MKKFRETKIASFVLIWILVGGILLLSKRNVYAETIHSNQYLKDNNDTTQAINEGSDYENIMYALEQDGTVTLVPGETYNLSDEISLESGWKIDATGATIYCPGALFTHSLTKTNYGSLKNVTIQGGTWLTKSSKGYEKTSIHFTHAQNIKLLDMTIKITNYEGHTIELVACKNVTIQNCKITPKGKPGKKSVEEQIQIDIATGTTYPAIAGTKYANGATCKNIKVIRCTVKGNRAICANYSPRESKYLGKFHSNITIKNCKLTGMTSEALALFNTSSATVTGNTIVTNAPLSRDSYSVGCHFHLFGNNSASEKGKINVSNNTIKGGRQALYFYSHSSAQYGTVTIKNNRLYCKKGKENALKTSSVKKVSSSKNKTYEWK